MKRLFAAVATGSVLFAGSFGFAQFQAIAAPGIAAQGSAFTAACAAALNVSYHQTAGVVDGVAVDQVPAGNCAGLTAHVSILDPADVELDSTDVEINGGEGPVTISNVVAIHRAVVTIANTPLP